MTCYYQRQLDRVEQGGIEWNRMLIFKIKNLKVKIYYGGNVAARGMFHEVIE